MDLHITGGLGQRGHWLLTPIVDLVTTRDTGGRYLVRNSMLGTTHLADGSLIPLLNLMTIPGNWKVE